MYTVKDVAKIMGVSVHTVRYYDDKGLIPGTKRNGANRRVFDDNELEWLFVSHTLASTGLPLTEVKRYIDLYMKGDDTVPERYAIFLEQRKRTLAQIEKLQNSMKLLDKKIEHYGKLLSGEPNEWNHEFMKNLIFNGGNKDGE